MVAWTPVTIGRRILRNSKIITLDGSDEIYIYDSKAGYYDCKNLTILLMRRIMNGLSDNYSTYRMKEVLSYIKDSTRRRVDQDEISNLINLENCILDVETLVTEKHSSKRFIPFRIPVKYDMKVDTSEWCKYVQSLVSTEEKADTLQEYVGYVFVNHQKAKKLLFPYGPNDSGKSTFFDILIEFFGKQNCSNLSLHQLCEKFTNAELYGKLVNIRADMDYKMEPKSVNLIKSLTGGDTIMAQKKQKDPFSFKNRAKIFLSANGIPVLPLRVVDDSFYNRWIPIEFPNSFKGDLRDYSIIEKFTTPEAKPAILKWALEGLKRLRENNWNFTFQPSKEEVEKWFKSGYLPLDNDVESFLSEKCNEHFMDIVEKKVLFNAYFKWCEEKDKISLAENAFHRKVKNNRIFKVSECKPTVDGKQIHAWKGISLK